MDEGREEEKSGSVKLDIAFNHMIRGKSSCMDEGREEANGGGVNLDAAFNHVIGKKVHVV